MSLLRLTWLYARSRQSHHMLQKFAVQTYEHHASQRMSSSTSEQAPSPPLHYQLHLLLVVTHVNHAHLAQVPGGEQQSEGCLQQLGHRWAAVTTYRLNTLQTHMPRLAVVSETKPLKTRCTLLGLAMMSPKIDVEGHKDVSHLAVKRGHCLCR